MHVDLKIDPVKFQNDLSFGFGLREWETLKTDIFTFTVIMGSVGSKLETFCSKSISLVNSNQD